VATIAVAERLEGWTATYMIAAEVAAKQTRMQTGTMAKGPEKIAVARRIVVEAAETIVIDVAAAVAVCVAGTEILIADSACVVAVAAVVAAAVVVVAAAVVVVAAVAAA
jgi:hypothetical protein